MAKRVAVVLSGCGVYDGSEIYEAVITLLRLDQAGAVVKCFAPDMQQLHVINHATGKTFVCFIIARHGLWQLHIRFCRGSFYFVLQNKIQKD